MSFVWVLCLQELAYNYMFDFALMQYRYSRKCKIKSTMGLLVSSSDFIKTFPILMDLQHSLNPFSMASPVVK